MAARCAHVNRCTERRQLERVASFRKRAAQRARQRARQFAQLYLVHRSSLRRTSNHENCILREMHAYIDLRCILSRIIYKLRYKDIVGNYRSREYSEEKVRYITSFHRITERGSAFRIKRNLHGASRVVAFATSCHALSSLSSRLIPIGSLQRENRLATISGDLLLFRLVSPLCLLSRYVFPCLATQKSPTRGEICEATSVNLEIPNNACLRKMESTRLVDRFDDRCRSPKRRTILRRRKIVK